MSDSETAVSWHDSIAPDFQDGYQRSRGFRDRFRAWAGLIMRYAQAGDRVMDAGCGAGTFALEAASVAARVDGIDGSERMIELARADAARRGIANATFEVAMFDTLSARAGQYDLVLCSSVLEYLPDLAEELARLTALLRPGGRLIVSLPNGRSYYRHAESWAYRLTGRPRYYRHVNHVPSSTEVREILHQLGFTVLETVYYADPPLPRFVNRLAGGSRYRKTMFASVAARL